LYDFHNDYQPFSRLGFSPHSEQELAEAVRRMRLAVPSRTRKLSSRAS
jgi:hypothetical protein